MMRDRLGPGPPVCVLASLLLVANACGNGNGPFDAQVTGDAPVAMTCSPDPLHTGLGMPTAIDDYDCAILQFAQHYAEPDPMIFKAIIYVESRFQFDAAACLNLPCNMPMGWTTAESQCFGLMQVVPACGGSPDDAGLLVNGHPNLTLDTGSSLWPTSIFNPSVNIEIGIAGIAGNRMQVMQQFPGCTTDQYTMMAIGNYNDYGSTLGCTQYNTDYANVVLPAYQQYSTASGWPAHAY